MSSTTPKTVYGNPATVKIAVVSNDVGGTVVSVVLFANGVQIATIANPVNPHTFMWTNPIDGTYEIYAKATDNYGISTESSRVSVRVVNSIPLPIVQTELRAGVSGYSLSMVSAGLACFNSVVQNDVGGSITREYFLNSDQTPFLTDSINVGTSSDRIGCLPRATPAGTHTVRSKVTSEIGAVAENTITLKVREMGALTNDNSSQARGYFGLGVPLAVGDSITLRAIQGVPEPGQLSFFHQTDTSAFPLVTYARTASALGTTVSPNSSLLLQITAQNQLRAGYIIPCLLATDGVLNCQTTGIDSNQPILGVQERLPATLSFAAPSTADYATSISTSANFTPENYFVTLIRTGLFDADTGEKLAERVLGSLSGAAISIQQPLKVTENRRVIAVVRSDRGQEYASAPVSVSLKPAALSIAGFAAGQVINIADNEISLGGVLSGALNSSVYINGRLLPKNADGKFAANSIPLQAGQNVLSVLTDTLSPSDFGTKTQTITVNSTRAGMYAVELDNPYGDAFTDIPHKVTVTISKKSADANADTVEFVMESGDPNVPAPISLTGDGPWTLTLSYPNVGSYSITANFRKTGETSPIFSAKRYILVSSSYAQFDVARQVYNDLLSTLRRGAGLRSWITRAESEAVSLDFFTDTAVKKFRDTFEYLGKDDAIEAAKSLGDVVHVMMRDNLMEITLSRTEGTERKATFVYLVRGRDGLWRIAEM